MVTGTQATTRAGLIREGVVLADFWGPRCAPCLALMPAVEALTARLGDRVCLIKIDATENRELCRELGVMGLPTYLILHRGVELRRLSGEAVTAKEIESALLEVLDEIENEEAIHGTQGETGHRPR